MKKNRILAFILLSVSALTMLFSMGIITPGKSIKAEAAAGDFYYIADYPDNGYYFKVRNNIKGSTATIRPVTITRPKGEQSVNFADLEFPFLLYKENHTLYVWDESFSYGRQKKLQDVKIKHVSQAALGKQNGGQNNRSRSM